MTNLVPREDIERIVGIARDPEIHYARAVSAEQTVYILHSKRCLDSGIDLRQCQYSLALDRGIDEAWANCQDVPVMVGARERLVPLRVEVSR